MTNVFSLPDLFGGSHINLDDVAAIYDLSEADSPSNQDYDEQYSWFKLTIKFKGQHYEPNDSEGTFIFRADSCEEAEELLKQMVDQWRSGVIQEKSSDVTIRI